MNPKTIPLVRGQNYWTCNSHFQKCYQNGGWLYVRNANGQKGFVPLKLLQGPRTMDHLPTVSENDPILNVVNEVAQVPTAVPQQIEPQIIPAPVTDANGIPLILPHSPLDDDVQ